MKRKKVLQVLAVAAVTGTLVLGQLLPQNVELSRQTVKEENVQPVRQAKNEKTRAADNAGDYTVEKAEESGKEDKEEQKDKEETVYVKANADGTPEKVTVETLLRAPENGARIRDFSTLSDIRNQEGDEEYTKDPDGTLWWENKGADIQYKGIAGEELPVTVHVQYFLDEKEISPERLAGKTGHLRMRFTYENREKRTVTVNGKKQEVCVPFAVMSTCLLPSEVFENVEITNGKLISMGTQSLAVGTAFPGLEESLKLTEYEPTKEVELPEYVEICADVKDFELSFTATVVTPGLFAQLEEENLKDADDLTDSMKKLMDATDDLVEGTDALQEGTQTFRDYMGEYLDGVHQLYDGTGQLQQGVSLLNEKKAELINGAKSLEEGLKALDIALQGLDAGGEAVTKEPTEPATEETLDAALAGLSEQTAALQALLQAVKLPDGASLDAQATEKAQQAARAAFSDALAACALPEEELSEVQAALEASISEISVAGLLTDDSQNVAQLAQVSADMEASLKALESCVRKLQENGGTAGTLEAQVAALQQNVSALHAGSEALAQGVAAFGEGIGQLFQGSEALTKGTGMLAEAGDQLYDGLGELTEGTKTLADGVKTYKEDGIEELGKLAGSDLQEVLCRMRALREADGTYSNYAGIADGSTGSVRFIIETEEIAP